MKIYNTHVYGIDESLIDTIRVPFKSFVKSDSYRDKDKFVIGEKDLDLAKRLANSKAGDSDGKFLRTINVKCLMDLPAYLISELATYKVGTVMNSSSIQHTGAKEDYDFTNFAIDDTDDQEVINALKTNISAINHCRKMYKETKDYKWFRLMRQLMPMSFEYTISFTANYQTLKHIWKDRHNHRLKEWHEICHWIEGLPYAKGLIIPNESV